MSYNFTKLSEVSTTETLNSEDHVLVEQGGEIKRVPNIALNAGGGSGSGIGITYYTFSQVNTTKPSDYMYSAFDGDGNEIDNVEVARAFNKGIVKARTNIGGWPADIIVPGYYLSDHRELHVYLPGADTFFDIVLGEIDPSQI